jgi:heat-inducible transcriptional repressor
VLTERQELILQLVVDAYLASARPVPSKEVAEMPGVEWGPSTVRAELALLESEGYLTHPHTSAGRVPTDSGYRRYVDLLLESGQAPGEARMTLHLSQLRREVDEAMRETTSALAQVTDLVAMATAPQLGATTTIHRIEVLRLQANRVVVIAIASSGDVYRRVFEFERAVDPGVVEWASSYLNEQLVGLGIGARMIGTRLADPGLDPTETRFVSTVAPAFTELQPENAADLYMDGTARLLSEQHIDDLPRADELMRALERRADVLSMLRSSLAERSVFLWIGDENPQPTMRSASVVGANYGLGHRNLGAVGVVGPRRMDYATAIASVRVAARELSRYFETVYSD